MWPVTKRPPRSSSNATAGADLTSEGGETSRTALAVTRGSVPLPTGGPAAIGAGAARCTSGKASPSACSPALLLGKRPRSAAASCAPVAPRKESCITKMGLQILKLTSGLCVSCACRLNEY